MNEPEIQATIAQLRALQEQAVRLAAQQERTARQLADTLAKTTELQRLLLTRDRDPEGA
jgi:chaperonin cofactor prefoldin